MFAPLVLALGLAAPARAWWYADSSDEHRNEKIAAWVVGMLAGTALIAFAVWYSMRRRRRVLAEFAVYRPPPPPGVVGYDVSVRCSVRRGRCEVAARFSGRCRVGETCLARLTRSRPRRRPGHEETGQEWHAARSVRA